MFRCKEQRRSRLCYPRGGEFAHHIAAIQHRMRRITAVLGDSQPHAPHDHFHRMLTGRRQAWSSPRSLAWTARLERVLSPMHADARR